MKKLTIIVFLFVIFSCKENMTTSKFFLQSISFNHHEVNAEIEINPDSLILQQIRQNDLFDPSSSFSLQKLKNQNVIEYFILYESNSLCKNTYLIFTKDAIINTIMQIEKNCDTDLSRASYEYYNYIMDNDYNITIEYIQEIVVDKTLIDENGYLLNNLTRDEARIKIDTNYFNLNLDELKKIKKWPAIGNVFTYRK